MNLRNPGGWPSFKCRQRPSFRCRLTSGYERHYLTFYSGFTVISRDLISTRGNQTAEGVGFEPTVPLPVHQLSGLANSATLAPLRFWRTRNAIPLPTPSGARLPSRFRRSLVQAGWLPLANSLPGPLQKCCWNRCKTSVGRRVNTTAVGKPATLGVIVVSGCVIHVEEGPRRNWGSFPSPAFGGLCRLKPALQAVVAVALKGVVRSAGLSARGSRLKPALQAVSAVNEVRAVRFRPPLGGRCRLVSGAER